jgi:hypothetical protein
MKPSSGLGPRDIALGKTIMEERVITSFSDLRPSLLHGHVADCLLHHTPFQFFFLHSYCFTGAYLHLWKPSSSSISFHLPLQVSCRSVLCLPWNSLQSFILHFFQASIGLQPVKLHLIIIIMLNSLSCSYHSSSLSISLYLLIMSSIALHPIRSSFKPLLFSPVHCLL